jgi:hypothetical protein
MSLLPSFANGRTSAIVPSSGLSQRTNLQAPAPGRPSLAARGLAAAIYAFRMYFACRLIRHSRRGQASPQIWILTGLSIVAQ